jgi:hypothetical protein
MSGEKRDSYTPVSEQVYFDPDNCDSITQDNVQGAVEDLCNEVATSASPGFTWGRTGNTSSGTWLLNDGVASDKTGRVIFLDNAKLEAVYVSNELAGTFDVEVYEHNGTTYTLITTVSLVATRAATFSVASLSLTKNKEVAMKVVNGSAKNVVVGVIISGSLP